MDSIPLFRNLPYDVCFRSCLNPEPLTLSGISETTPKTGSHYFPNEEAVPLAFVEAFKGSQRK
jgi:hypothetical protein